MPSEYKTGAVPRHTPEECEASELRMVTSTQSSNDVLPNRQVTSDPSAGAKPEPMIGLVAARALSWDAAAGIAKLRVGQREFEARLAPEVDPLILRRAVEVSEHVIVQPEGEEWLILGVLRNCATPGIDVGDEYTIEARRIRVKAEHELTLTSGLARIALASIGRIESAAKFITSRAAAVHKIIGRAIEMN